MKWKERKREKWNISISFAYLMILPCVLSVILSVAHFIPARSISQTLISTKHKKKTNEMDEEEVQIQWKDKRLCNSWIAIKMRESEEENDINGQQWRWESERKVHEKCRQIKVPMMN